jgi:hypothetical protein
VAKRKREVVNEDMRERLVVNREGKLTTGQWLELTTEPLVTLLLLLAPALVILGPRLVVLLRFGWWLLLLLAVAALIFPLLMRARRYARLPVHFGRFYADVRDRPWWKFWQPSLFYDEDDQALEFKRWLAPRPPLKINGEYLVYYLNDRDRRVVLSLAPADHEEAERWQPTYQFKLRQAKRL